ncbi:phosphofructokinase [Holotrichia oblita]|nr:phosphofructokinase [Holotrichia oblita]
MKKIAVLTSGGDAPGMNAAIRAVIRYACSSGMEVVGVERGFLGLIQNQMRPMDMRSVSDIIQRGGTVLKTARCTEFITPEGQDEAVANAKANGIEGVVVIGGDGSFLGARALTRKGIPSVGIPGTIDNDLAYTDFTLGFDTACNVAFDAINKIRDTMNSHERVSIIEVMGRHCGDLALYSGLTGGAEVIIVPEIGLDSDAIAAKLNKSKATGKQSGIIILAEGAGKAADLAKVLSTKSGFSVRSTVLGYIQRGGNPSMFDRLFATKSGVRAVQLLKEDRGGMVVGISNNQIIEMEIDKALSIKKQFDTDLYNIAMIISR